MPVPAAHQWTLPIANAAVSQPAGVDATPTCRRRSHRRATLAPPNRAVAIPWSKPGPKSTTNGQEDDGGHRGKRRVEASLGARHELQPRHRLVDVQAPMEEPIGQRHEAVERDALGDRQQVEDGGQDPEGERDKQPAAAGHEVGPVRSRRRRRRVLCDFPVRYHRPPRAPVAMHHTDEIPASDARPRLSTLVVEAVALFLALRIGLSLLGAFMATQDVPSPCHFEEALAGWQTLPELLRDGPAFSLAGVWERWDACWYMKIATYGYEPGERSVAFFPLFPAAVRAIGTLTTLPYPVAGMIVSGLAYVAAITGLLRLVTEKLGLRGRPSHGPAAVGLPRRVLPVRTVHRVPVPRCRRVDARAGWRASVAPRGGMRRARRPRPSAGPAAGNPAGLGGVRRPSGGADSDRHAPSPGWA